MQLQYAPADQSFIHKAEEKLIKKENGTHLRISRSSENCQRPQNQKKVQKHKKNVGFGCKKEKV